MSPDHSHLGYLDLAIAAALILVNVGLSLALRLDLAGKWLVAGLRTIVQLLLIGVILEWVFAEWAKGSKAVGSPMPTADRCPDFRYCCLCSLLWSCNGFLPEGAAPEAAGMPRPPSAAWLWGLALGLASFAAAPISAGFFSSAAYAVDARNAPASSAAESLFTDMLIPSMVMKRVKSRARCRARLGNAAWCGV